MHSCLLVWAPRLRLSPTSPAAPALCSASEETMAWPLCTLLLLLAAQAVALAWSPQEEDRIIGGGIYDADLNDEWVQRALHFAISEYNKATEDEYYRRPLRVLRAREQTVAGMNYFFDVEVGRTICTKSQPNLDTCAFHEQPELQKKQLCSFEIYEVPWEDRMSLVNSRCQEA
uniref:Cystatin SN n=3 Tax=Pan troglodytes TaxID=9598 RepID=H2QK36_PANTR